MTYRLIDRDVEASCKRVLPTNDNEHNCSGFVRSVADDLLLLVPGASANADGQLDFMQLIGSVPGVFSFLGRGRLAESRAVTAAQQGALVICGMTSAELQRNRKEKIRNGHVAIVVNGWSSNGWPLAWWGQKGGTAGRREGLSKCFRAGDRASISYFAYSAPSA